jgi:hypothetical protein
VRIVRESGKPIAQVARELGINDGTLANWVARVTSCNREPSESDVVYDHIRLRQHQIVAVACIVIGIGAWHVKEARYVGRGETVGGSSGGSQLSPCGGSTQMISDGCPDANRTVLVKSVGEDLLPTAQPLGLRRPRLPVAAPCTGNRHIDLFSHLIPGQALVTELQDLLGGGGVSRRAAATHGDAGLAKLMAHGGQGNAQLGTDLAQGPTLGVQVRRTLNVHGATVTSISLVVSGFGQEFGGRQFVVIWKHLANSQGHMHKMTGWPGGPMLARRRSRRVDEESRKELWKP